MNNADNEEEASRKYIRIAGSRQCISFCVHFCFSFSLMNQQIINKHFSSSLAVFLFRILRVPISQSLRTSGRRHRAPRERGAFFVGVIISLNHFIIQCTFCCIFCSARLTEFMFDSLEFASPLFLLFGDRIRNPFGWLARSSPLISMITFSHIFFSLLFSPPLIFFFFRLRFYLFAPRATT